MGAWREDERCDSADRQGSASARPPPLSDNWFYLSLFLSLALSQPLSPWPWQAKGKMLQVMDELKRALADSTGPILCPIPCP